MEASESSRIRNVVLAGHSGSGKTTLSEAMLLAAGAITRAGRVSTGNTVSDYDDIEHAMGHSLSLTALAFDWRGHRLNVLDTPGHSDLVGELVAGLAGAETVALLVDAGAGIQPGTEAAWERAQEAGVRPRVFLVTHVDTEKDEEKVDFDAVVEALRERFGNAVAATSRLDDAGAVRDVVRDPSAESDAAMAAARDRLVELAAECSDDVMARYIEGEPVDTEMLAAGLRDAVAAGVLCPVVPVGGISGTGVAALLDVIVDALPAPAPSGAEPPGKGASARILKSTVDPFAGRLSIVKVLSGTLTVGLQLTNARDASEERVTRLLVVRGRQQTEVPQLVAGEIGAIPKLGHGMAGDVLVSGRPASPPAPLPFPLPTYRSAILPHAQDEMDRLATALARLREQDPTLSVEHDPGTGEVILVTVGPAQADLVAERLRRTYGLTAHLAVPRVPYRETISAAVEREYRHKKQTGGHGQFGHVIIRVEPLTLGSGFQFAEQVVGGAVPRQFIPAVEAGVVEGLHGGPLTGSQVVDVKVTLLGGSAHPVDSNEISFKMAAAHALKEAVMAASPELLEPVMHVTLRVPSQRVGDVVSDLTSRRGSVRNIESQGEVNVIDALAPLAEVQRYAPDLSALSGGRGTCTIAMDHYEVVPRHARERALANQHASG